MPFAPELRTHSQKVCTLYKRAMRQMESHYCARQLVRYQQVILRAEFDKNRCVCDEREQKNLLRAGEARVFKWQHPLPGAKFAKSTGLAGGVAFGRQVVEPDWLLDYWHPLEKAQYPEYFKRREIRKLEYERHWCNCTLW